MLAVIAFLALIAGTRLDCVPRVIPFEPEVIEWNGLSMLVFSRIDLQYRCQFQ